MEAGGSGHGGSHFLGRRQVMMEISNRAEYKLQVGYGAGMSDF
jgi:hypothetical protein